MPDKSALEPDKWHSIDGRWIRYSSEYRCWQDEVGNRLDDAQSDYSDSLDLEKFRSLTVADSQFHTSKDQQTGVQSTVQTGDTSIVTAAELQEQGVQAYKRIAETRKRGEGRGKKHDSQAYRKSSNPKEDFAEGKVIQVPWVEPTDGETVVTDFGDESLTRTRRLVVVVAGERECAVIPILTYLGLGVTAQHLVKSHHTIIYTSKEAPPLLPGEDGAIDSLRKPGIRVIGTHPSDILDPHSRLNYGKVYQLDHQRCDIYVFGRIHGNSLRDLTNQYRVVQNQIRSRLRTSLGHNTTEAAVAQQQSALPAWSSAHQRVDSVQSKVQSPSLDKRRLSNRESIGSTAGPSGTYISPEQRQSAEAMARKFGVNLTVLPLPAFVRLARMPTDLQRHAIIKMLEVQNPQRFAQLQQQLQALKQANATEANPQMGAIEDEEEEEEAQGR